MEVIYNFQLGTPKLNLSVSQGPGFILFWNVRSILKKKKNMCLHLATLNEFSGWNVGGNERVLEQKLRMETRKKKYLVSNFNTKVDYIYVV